MSNKVKTPWYKSVLGFIERRFNQSFGDFILTLLEAVSIFFGAILIYSLPNLVNTTDKVESTTSYSESSTIVPVYTRYNDGTENFNKVIVDLEFYSTKPEKTEVTRLVMTSTIKGMKLSRKSSKGEAESYYARKYEGYQGAPKPVYSYSPTIELVAYKDGTYEWKSSDNWKLDNEAELQSYISSSPTKEN